MSEVMTHNEDKNTSYLLSLRYESCYGQHNDSLYVQQHNINTVIDTLPSVVANDLMSLGDYLESDIDNHVSTHDYIKGKLFNNNFQEQIFEAKQNDFVRHPGHNLNIEPQYGRFYPGTLFNTEKLLTLKNNLPIRIIGLMHEKLLVSTCHPLCNYDTTFSIERIATESYESGQETNAVKARRIPDFFTGPGMQLRYGDEATDFFSNGAFQRTDSATDSEFYTQTRLVNHLDTSAQAQLKKIYNSIIPEQCEILDLMTSINSHFDDKLEAKKVTGLGMNKKELDSNPALGVKIVHDINEDSRLPFDDASFDIVVCNLSIEYSTQPDKLFDEVARILRPHGRFIISFSNRWFPTKAIQVWNNLHDFERIGLVMEHFIASAHFGGINTYSLRGLPRPVEDKHNVALSDPIYVVWADVVKTQALDK